MRIVECSMNVKDVEASYDRLASYYDLANIFYFLGYDKKYRAELVEHLQLQPHNLVLELCSGTGINFRYLQQFITYEGNIVGVDVSLKMLHKARKKIEHLNVNLVRADINHLPFRNNTFDAVITTFCLKVNPLMEGSLSESARVLKPNGRFGILSNHQPHTSIGTVVTKLFGGIFNIAYDANIDKHLQPNFNIVTNKVTHGNLVQLTIGIKKQASELILPVN
jgi:demethylmenaquinone methyltransferase/2-methoxy-6-polyprenyl-1,4-benzoquinol methylase